jgi:hypothetical protein
MSFIPTVITTREWIEKYPLETLDNRSIVVLADTVERDLNSFVPLVEQIAAASPEDRKAAIHDVREAARLVQQLRGELRRRMTH